MRDHHLLPPRVGHHWNDQAFQRHQEKPQQLEGEWRGERKYLTKGDYTKPMPEVGLTARQLMEALWTKRESHLYRKKGLPGLGKDNHGGSVDAAAGGAAGSHVGAELDDQRRFVTLDDKVLRFYAFFRERAPEGGAKDWWHRRVVIFYFPEDETIAIEEPVVLNSGMRGGRLLKRQRVPADPRQREYFPMDEYVSLNFFNVGVPVRLHAHEYFIYDCDPFTREFLTMLGVEVGLPSPPPGDDFFSSYKEYREKLATGSFGIKSEDYHVEVSERAAHFLTDSGKVLKFYGLLDERGRVPGGLLRKMNVMMYIEDGTISILEKQATEEASPGMFLSRSWIPKGGSLAKCNELTFAHRVNGKREPYIGPDAYYKDKDLNVGMKLHVLGRDIFLYDCDDFTRSFLKQRYGITVNPSIDVSADLISQLKPKQTRRVATDSPAQRAHPNSQGVCQTGLPKDELRFMMAIANPKRREDEPRRFTLTWFTDTAEGTVHESTVNNSGFLGGLFLKRSTLPKPAPPSHPRNAPERTALEGKPREMYQLEDFRVGAEILVNGMMMRLISMDLHTKRFLEGSRKGSRDEARTRAMLMKLQEHLRTSYGTATKVFTALDLDKDGRVSQKEFTTALQAFHITDDPSAALAVFHEIAPSEDAYFLRPEDVAKFLRREGGEGGLSGAIAGAEEVDADREAALRREALLQLKNRLDARCLGYREMFRLCSTMPRAYRGKRADVLALTNPDKDAIITPVQLRRGIEEVLGGGPTEESMRCLLQFFFPGMPKEAQLRERDETPEFAVDLSRFHALYNEMTQLTMLSDRLPPMANCVMGTMDSPPETK